MVPAGTNKVQNTPDLQYPGSQHMVDRRPTVLNVTLAQSIETLPPTLEAHDRLHWGPQVDLGGVAGFASFTPFLSFSQK